MKNRYLIILLIVSKILSWPYAKYMFNNLTIIKYKLHARQWPDSGLIKDCIVCAPTGHVLDIFINVYSDNSNVWVRKFCIIDSICNIFEYV